MPSSFSQKAKLKCPQCQVDFTADVWMIVDAGERPDLAARCSDGSIHVVTCPNGHSGLLAAPLLYHNRPKKQLILGIPPGMERQEVQEVAQQLIGRLRQNLLILPGSEYLDRPQVVPFDLVPAAIAGKLEEALAQAQAQMEQAQAEIEKNPALKTALRTLDQNQSLAQTLQEWVSADTVDTSKQFLQAHPELLTDTAEATLSALLDLTNVQQDADAMQMLTDHRDLLGIARREGIDAAYAQIPDDSEIAEPATAEQSELEARLRELGINSQQDLERAVQEHPELRGLIERALLSDNPLLQALDALLKADSMEAVNEVVRTYPILLDDEALQAIREGIANARRAGQEEMAQRIEERLGTLTQLKTNSMPPKTE